MTDTTDKALDAFVVWTKQHPSKWPLGQIKAEGKFSHFADAETDSAWMGFEAAYMALRSERDAAIAREKALLAKARPDALREAAKLVRTKPMRFTGCREDDVRDALSCAILALIDTPTPSAPAPLSLKSLEDVPQEERERRRDAEFARRGWTQPSPEAVARAAMEDAVAEALYALSWAKANLADYSFQIGEGRKDFPVLDRALARARAAIVAKAGGGE